MSTDATTRLGALSDEQKRLLAARLSRRRPSAATTIPRQDPSRAVFPVSFAQQRFWFLTQVSGPNAAFNCTELHRLRGPVDAAAMELALAEVVRRHAALRTTFEVTDGVPQQRVHARMDVPLPLDDLRDVPAAEREARLWQGIAAELRRPWSLAGGPLVRGRLWRLADDDHQLIVVMHHIVADGWSQALLVREIATLYDAFAKGQPSPLPELPIQYPDFSVWQREWANGPEFARQLAYWKQAMQDPPVLQMPAIRSAAGEPGRGTHRRFYLSKTLSADVRALCQREGVTVFMGMLAAFGVLLARYSRQDDVVIGSPVANRDRAEVEGLIGSFMNPLPIRVDLRGNPSFRSLLARVRESALGAFANQHVPFDVLVRSLPVDREAGATPLFQAMFLLQNFGGHALAIGKDGLQARAWAAMDDLKAPDDFEHPGDLMYPIALEVLEVGALLGGCVEFAPEFGATMTRFPDHLRTLLAAVAADPDVPVEQAPLLTARERATLLTEWSHDTREVDVTCAHHLIEAQAAARPDATAVIAGDTRASYRALNARANAIADALRARGVGPEVPVGLLVERSVDMVAAVVGVMKAGGAYVPLDPAYPPDRLRFIAHDSGMRALVTSGALATRAAELCEGTAVDGGSVVILDAVPHTFDGADVDGGATPDHLAYVIYTSGSTGLPKGTMVTHASLTNAFRGWEEAYDLSRLTVHLQMASLSFDVCTGDLVRALGSGAALVVAPQEVLFTPPALYDLMVRHHVDAAEFVPVVLRDLVSHVEASGRSLGFMQLLAAGSDSWYVHEYDRIKALCGPATRLVNSYGLTEATIDSTYFDGTGATASEDGLVPLGRTFPNTEILLLDAHLQLVPVGVPGELCVAGPALARGYLRRPDLTAERFVPHPFSSVPGARLYRTGDLARYLPDGTLELLGRIDTQVKLRGFRIELAEIESVLREHAAVGEAAVVVRQDEPGDRRLVAYVVLRQGQAVTPSTLRRALRELLPEYMVPAAVVLLEALPLTPNGKIDRAALPAPDGARQLDEAFVAPRTALEQKLAAAWCDLLRLEQVGVNDNFFDLGGHSLLLMQLQARLAGTLGLDVRVVDLFRFPTISTLAAHLSEPAAAQAPAFAAARGRAERQREASRLRRQAAEALRDTAS